MFHVSQMSKFNSQNGCNTKINDKNFMIIYTKRKKKLLIILSFAG